MINAVRNKLNERKDRSTWDKAVTLYAHELLDTVEDYYNWNKDEFEFPPKDLLKVCLNGADNWNHYSWSGCSLCYNYDIDERINVPSKRGIMSGARLLNEQARALRSAFWRLNQTIKLVICEAEKEC